MKNSDPTSASFTQLSGSFGTLEKYLTNVGFTYEKYDVASFPQTLSPALRASADENYFVNHKGDYLGWYFMDCDGEADLTKFP